MSGNRPFPLAGLLDAGVLTSIIIALLYTAGLSYAYHYFAEFHLGLLGLEIPQAYFLLYGFQVIRNRVFSVLLCIIGSIGIYFLLRFLWRRSAGHSLSGEEGDTGPENAGGGRLLLLRIAILAGSPICLLLLFIVFSRIGASTGRSVYARELRNDFPSYARVKIRLKGEQNAWSEEWAAGCYRLLLRSKGRLYIFRADGITERMPTEIIPETEALAVRILPVYQSSEECQ